MAKQAETPVVGPTKQELQQAKGRAILDEIVALYFAPYPTFRPSYTDCAQVATLLYSVSVRHDISPGQRKQLELLRKKLVLKGVLQEDPCK